MCGLDFIVILKESVLVSSPSGCILRGLLNVHHCVEVIIHFVSLGVLLLQSVLAFGFCSLLLASFACKSTGSSGLDSATSKGAATAPACVKPQVVSYGPAANGWSLANSDAASNPDGSEAPIKVNIAAADLEHTESVSCGPDQHCTAFLNKPVDFNVDVPMPMFANVKLDFQQTNGNQGAVCMRTVKIGTTVSANPVCIGKVLKASVSVGVKVKKATDTNSGATTYNAHPFVRGNLSYSMPFFSAGARAGKKGLQFEATASMKGLTDNKLWKEVLPEKSVSARIDYKDLPAEVEQLRRAVIASATATSSNADLEWDHLIGQCDQSLN